MHVLRKTEETSPEASIKSMFATLELPGKPSGEFKAKGDEDLVSINITVARLGDIAFVGLGAEVLCELGLAIKQASPFEHTIIITHCNGTADYMVPQSLYIQQGYEVKTSPFASTAAEKFVKHVVKMLHQL